MFDNPAPFPGDMAGNLAIGLVNLMPPGAMRATEAQFRSLLQAAPGRDIALRLFSLAPSSGYESLEALWSASLDGLIVTGMEPQAASMADEPCWPALRQLVDWAGEQTISVIWSCLAAHAAVFRLDGLRRQKLPQKLSGIFPCEKTSEHRIFAGAPARWQVPHSRHNTLSEAMLIDHGYTILSRGLGIGVDSFLKPHKNSLFLFFQGHPEYTPESLPGEYLRDIRRYLAGAAEFYPELPANCFDPAATAGFAALRARALTSRDPALLATLNLPAPPASCAWREPARRLADGWLAYLAAQKIGVPV